MLRLAGINLAGDIMKPFYRRTGIQDGESAEVAHGGEAVYSDFFRSCVVGHGIRGRWTEIVEFQRSAGNRTERFQAGGIREHDGLLSRPRGLGRRARSNSSL